MSLQDRIEALKAKHHALEEALEAENIRPRPDDAEISRLKKQKLQIKDEIANAEVINTSRRLGPYASVSSATRERLRRSPSADSVPFRPLSVREPWRTS